MLKKVLLSAALMGMMGMAAINGARAEEAAKPAEAAKVTEVKICPFMETEAVDEKKTATVGNYKVYLCCAGCVKKWNKLSAEDQLKKAEAALKIQEANAKKAG
jgi:hypothetical protein